jgi:hypothetical protein
VINGLQSKITLEQARRSNTFAIRYNDSDPKRAQGVVQSLLDTFVEDTLGMKRTDVTNARRFLESQIREYERRLTESENRLADFKRENLAMLPGEGADFFGSLQNAMANVRLLQARYDQLATRRDELRRQLEGEDPSMGVVRLRYERPDRHGNRGDPVADRPVAAAVHGEAPQHPVAAQPDRAARGAQDQRRIVVGRPRERDSMARARGAP